jgi:hypothetical protein
MRSRGSRAPRGGGARGAAASEQCQQPSPVRGQGFSGARVGARPSTTMAGKRKRRRCGAGLDLVLSSAAACRGVRPRRQPLQQPLAVKK